MRRQAEYFRKKIQFPFFEYYLKDKGTAMPEAYVFETGTNVWRKYDSLAAARRNRESCTSTLAGSSHSIRPLQAKAPIPMSAILRIRCPLSDM